MSEVIDISLPLHAEMPIWPGSAGLKLVPTMQLQHGDPANVSTLTCDVHVGTHVDAPWHFVEGGATVESLALSKLIGPAVVAYLPGVDAVKPDQLDSLALPVGTKRLLLRTHNSELWSEGKAEFQEDYVALTLEAAEWVVQKGIELIGVDYLSVQRYGDSTLTHQILLRAEVVIVEGLNLANIQPGIYELVCLPIRLVGADGAPARAVLRDASSISS